MKKILIVFAVLLGFAATVWAAPELLEGGKKVPGDDSFLTIWAHPKSNTTGLINATGATKAYNAGEVCDTASIYLETVTGGAVMNVALQVTYNVDPLDTSASGAIFTNAIGTDAAPYHQVDPGDTDTWKFDSEKRGFNRWRLNCLAGCGVSNTISEAYGICWRKSND